MWQAAQCAPGASVSPSCGILAAQTSSGSLAIGLTLAHLRAPNMPFGGFGSSGIGRENGVDAIHEYTENKSVFVELTGGTRDPFKLG